MFTPILLRDKTHEAAIRIYTTVLIKIKTRKTAANPFEPGMISTKCIGRSTSKKWTGIGETKKSDLLRPTGHAALLFLFAKAKNVNCLKIVF